MKTLKTLCIATVLTMMMAFPVMAQEVTDPTTVIKADTLIAELANHRADVEKQLEYFVSTQIDKDVAQAHVDVVEAQLKAYEKSRADNYLRYLDGVIYNLNETVRIKKEIVTNYTWLSQYNPYFATLIPQAQEDVIKAETWVKYYKEYKKAVEQEFSALGW